MAEIEVTKTDVSDVNRDSRASKTREKETRRKPWTPPSMVDAPPAPRVWCSPVLYNFLA